MTTEGTMRKFLKLFYFWLAMVVVVVVNLVFINLLYELKILNWKFGSITGGSTILGLIMCAFSIAAVFKVFIIGSKAKESSHT